MPPLNSVSALGAYTNRTIPKGKLSDEQCREYLTSIILDGDGVIPAIAAKLDSLGATLRKAGKPRKRKSGASEPENCGIVTRIGDCVEQVFRLNGRSYLDPRGKITKQTESRIDRTIVPRKIVGVRFIGPNEVEYRVRTYPVFADDGKTIVKAACPMSVSEALPLLSR